MGDVQPVIPNMGDVQSVIPDMGDVSESSTQHNSIYASDYVINVSSTFLWKCYIDTLAVYVVN